MDALKLSEILAQYPNFGIAETGGGCTAYRHERDDGGWLLITDVGGCDVPIDDDAIVMCGFYPTENVDDPAHEGVVVEIPVSEVEGWIDAHLGFTS